MKLRRPHADPLSPCRDKQFGMLSEEHKPMLGCMLGQFLQAFSHVGLFNSAIPLSQGGGAVARR